MVPTGIANSINTTRCSQCSGNRAVIQHCLIWLPARASPLVTSRVLSLLCCLAMSREETDRPSRERERSPSGSSRGRRWGPAQGRQQESRDPVERSHDREDDRDRHREGRQHDRERAPPSRCRLFCVAAPCGCCRQSSCKLHPLALPCRHEKTPLEVRAQQEAEKELRAMERSTRTVFAYNLSLKASARAAHDCQCGACVLGPAAWDTSWVCWRNAATAPHPAHEQAAGTFTRSAAPAGQAPHRASARRCC
jgi:hypothetical protein